MTNSDERQVPVRDLMRLTVDQRTFLLVRPSCDSHRQAAREIGRGNEWLRRQYRHPLMRHCLRTLDYDFLELAQVVARAELARMMVLMRGQLMSDDPKDRKEGMDIVRKLAPAKMLSSTQRTTESSEPLTINPDDINLGFEFRSPLRDTFHPRDRDECGDGG